MRALGIDPGSRRTGWGVVEQAGSRLCHVASGTIVLDARDAVAPRLARLHAAIAVLVREWTPDAVALERAFVARNVQSAFRLGETRGAVLAAVAAAGVTLHEYAPAQVKLAAVGHGGADKDSVGRGVTAMLRLGERPAVDAADALALALCHLQQAPYLAALARAGVRR
ncbi:MAG: crossover junction endodeoxyribonuclease RuvC [bacterium]|nr:crossover junction endodeoxyribonuclease RuvC [bacterium]